MADAAHAEILAFAQAHKLAVISSVAVDGTPQGAVVGIAVTDRFEIVFDTLTSSRKWSNLKAKPSIAMTLGWDAATLQLEGIAEELSGAALARYQNAYFAVWPDGPSRLSWPGITYFKISPRWARYSDFGTNPQQIAEIRFLIQHHSRRACDILGAA